MDNQNKYPRGGDGGIVKIIGDDNGMAIGGRGGRGGSLGCGQGGDGGGGVHAGVTLAIGGDGGDAGRHGRPALGACSTLERRPDLAGWPVRGLVDGYGIFLPGRGGDSYEVSIEIDGRKYCMNVLLRLLQIWNNSIIDEIDALDLKTEQQWWNCAVNLFPKETQKAMGHIRYCEDVAAPQGLLPKSPYV